MNVTLMGEDGMLTQQGDGKSAASIVPCRRCGGTERQKSGGCAACSRAYSRNYDAAHKERKRAYNASYRQSHRGDIRARRDARRQELLPRKRASARLYAEAHKDEIRAKRLLASDSVMLHYGGKCACCGEDRREFLTIDHVDGAGAKHREAVARAMGKKRAQSDDVYWDIINNDFPSGFRVLCFNCNSARGFYGYCPHEGKQ